MIVPGSVNDPATLLRDTLARLEMSQAALARRSDVSTKHVNQIAQGLMAVSPAIAVRFERATGVPAKHWLDVSAAWQLGMIRHRRPRIWWSPQLGVLEEQLSGEPQLKVIRCTTNELLSELPQDAVELVEKQ